MLCSCGRRRRVAVDITPLPKSPPQPFVAKIQGFTPEPLMLTIRIPKRTRWAAHDAAHKELFREKALKSLQHLERLPFGEQRFRGAIILFNDMIAQPMCLAAHPTFREVSVKKFEELEAWFKANPQTRFEDEFRETSWQWHELMAELHDHPLYVE